MRRTQKCLKNSGRICGGGNEPAQQSERKVLEELAQNVRRDQVLKLGLGCNRLASHCQRARRGHTHSRSRPRPRKPLKQELFQGQPLTSTPNPSAIISIIYVPQYPSYGPNHDCAK